MVHGIIVKQVGKDELYKIWHKASDNVIIYIHQGNGGIVFNDKIYPIEKGALCFIPANVMHYTFPENTSVYKRSKLCITNEHLVELLNLDNDLSLFSKNGVIYAKTSEDEQNIIEKVWEIFENLSQLDIDKNAIYSGCVLQLLGILKANNFVNAITSSNVITNAMQYINLHLRENLSVDSIAKNVNVSKYYFCRIFKKETGTSVMQYVLMARLSMAKNLLRFSNKTISKISEECGFQTLDVFCHAFKKQFGISALNYKKSINID